MALGPIACAGVRVAMRAHLRATAGDSWLESVRAVSAVTDEALNLSLPDAELATGASLTGALAALDGDKPQALGDGKILAAILAFFQSPQGQQLLSALIQMLIALIPKKVGALPSVFDLLSGGGAVMQAVVKGLTTADVALGTILQYLPMVMDEIKTGVTDAKVLVDKVLAMLPTGA